MANPTSDQLNDPEGHQLVQAIHDRKAQREELGRIVWVTSHRDEGTISATGANILADAVLAAGYRKPRTITTAEEMDRLGFQAVVLDDYGTPYVCERHRTDGTRNEWKPSGMDHLDDSEAILYHGPVTVVHDPEAAK